MVKNISIHGSCVALDGKGILMTGTSGRGKSSLAMQLIAQSGAKLVSDDQTEIWVQSGKIAAKTPRTLQNMLEARGVGLLHVPAITQIDEIVLWVDLDKTENQRMPPRRQGILLGIAINLLFAPSPDFMTVSHFSAAITLIAKYGWHKNSIEEA